MKGKYKVLRDNIKNVVAQEFEKTLPIIAEEYEAKIRRQAAEITRLLEENKRLKAENGNSLWNIEQARAEGAEAAWELARKIILGQSEGGMNDEDYKGAFGSGIAEIYVIKNYTYSEAAAKVAEWEKAKEEIKIGDIITHEEYDKDLCVMCISPDKKHYNAIDGYGTYYLLTKEMITKSGRHIDTDSFLKQIRNEQE